MSTITLNKYSDLDEDRGQAVLRNVKTNFLKMRAEEAAKLEYLERRLTSLDGTKRKAEVRIVRGIKEVKEHAEFLEKEKSRVEKAAFEREEKLRALECPESRPVTRKWVPVAKSPRRIPALPRSEFAPKESCKYEKKRSICKSFPCIPTENYTRLGYFENPLSYTVVCSVRGLSAKSKERLYSEIESTSVLKPLRVPYNQTVKREGALKKIMDNMRKKNEVDKPKDWSVRYGDSSPLRKSLKPINK